MQKHVWKKKAKFSLHFDLMLHPVERELRYNSSNFVGPKFSPKPATVARVTTTAAVRITILLASDELNLGDSSNSAKESNSAPTTRGSPTSCPASLHFSE